MSQQAYKVGFENLNDFQKDVLKECIKKRNGGISLAMGSGKSRLSAVLGLKQSKGEPILIVMSKSLLESWKTEIKKGFGDHLKFQVLHSDNVKNFSEWELAPETQAVLTTCDVISKVYKEARLASKLIRDVITFGGRYNNLQRVTSHYNRPTEPFISEPIGAELLFGKKWGCFIVDEIQKFTNIETDRCRGLVAISASHRWGLSGTMFDEPVAKRLLGYHLIIDHPKFPRNLPETELVLVSNEFKGVASTIVHRKNNDAYTPPNVNKQIIVNKLSREEELIYRSMKDIMKEIASRVARTDDIEIRRRFSSYLLAMITYLRQCIIAPLIPIANVAVDLFDYNNKSELSTILMDEIKKLGIQNYLNNPKNVISSRLQKVLDIIDRHPNEKLVVFSSFRTSLDLLKNVIKNRVIHTISGTMTLKSRGDTIDAFNETDDNSILLLTYDIGAEGLNLQSSNTVLLLDFWWNISRSDQAIARVLRQGQKSNIVNIYYFTSNTAIENAILSKHSDKLSIADELQNGPMVTKIKKVNVKDIVELISQEDILNDIQRLHINRK